MKINIPPLRDRPEDIIPLFQYFVEYAGFQLGLSKPEVSETDCIFLLENSWLGNVRELKNEATRFVISSTYGINNPRTNVPIGEVQALPDKMQALEKLIIEKELLSRKGDIKKTHTALGVPRQTLIDKMKKHAIKISH